MYFEGHFQYAICIDLVTTCWDHRNFSQADAIDRQEIIGKWKCFYRPNDKKKIDFFLIASEIFFKSISSINFEVFFNIFFFF